MNLIKECKIGNLRIIFYKDYKDTYLNFSDYVEYILKNINNNPLFRKFRKIQVIFVDNPRLSLLEKMDEGTVGYVSKREIKKGLNKIYVNIGFVYADAINEYNGNINKPDYIILMKYIINKVSSNLVHETTHLWHLRINLTQKIVEKNKKRITKALDNMLDKSKLYKGDVELGSLWLSLRNDLFTFLDYICTEGIARFYQRYSEDKLDYSDQSIKEWYGLAYMKADKMNKELGYIYSRFINFLKIRKSTNNEEFEKEIVKFYRAYCEDISNKGYDIGAHIYQTVLAYNDLEMNDLADLKYSDLMRLYEDSCKRINLIPVVTLFSSEGVFSYRKHVLMLTRLRKESEEFVIWH